LKSSNQLVYKINEKFTTEPLIGVDLKKDAMEGSA